MSEDARKDTPEALRERIRCLEAALKALRRDVHGGCWCNADRGAHSTACKTVRLLMRRAEDK